MLFSRRSAVWLGSLAGAALLAACNHSPTAPRLDRTPVVSLDQGGHGPAVSDPTGERAVGKAAIEPAYDDMTGGLVYILTPEKAPLPTHADGHAVAPLYIVAYPPNSGALTGSEHFNCEGVPGNCPDHDGLIADIATNDGTAFPNLPVGEPSVYGIAPAAVPGHDHLLAPPASHGDFNIAWEVKEVLFTPQAVTDNVLDTHITTESQLETLESAGDVREIDLGFSFTCAVVSPATYAQGTPIGG